MKMAFARSRSFHIWLEYRVYRNIRVIGAHLVGSLRSLAARLRGPSEPRLVRSAYGVDLRENWADNTFRFCIAGTYGPYLADLLAARREPFAFIDVGANQGLFSLLAARVPTCRQVIALEPVASTFGLLRDNSAVIGAQVRVDLLPAALSDRRGQAAIAVRERHSGVASLAHRDHGHREETIELVTQAEVDALIEPGIDIFVKIDVEGHEEVALEQVLSSAHRDRLAQIFIEIDERWTRPERIAAMLDRAGFSRRTRYGVGRHYDLLAERAA